MITICGLNIWGLFLLANIERGESICAGDIWIHLYILPSSSWIEHFSSLIFRLPMSFPAH